MTPTVLLLRKGAWFIYEYDLNIPWRHEIRIEDLGDRTDKTYPLCAAGDGAGLPDDDDIGRLGPDCADTLAQTLHAAWHAAAAYT